MKRLVALSMIILIIASLGVPYLALASPVADQPPQTPAATIVAEPVDTDVRPVVVYTTGADPPGPIDLTPLLQAVISLAVSLITAFLLPWLRAKYTYEQRQRIAAIYQTVVYAAEQMFGAGAGDRKLQWALEQLQAKGFTIDRALLEAQIKHMTDVSPYILDDPEEGVAAPPATTA